MSAFYFQLFWLFPLSDTERIKRGLVEKPEIEAARDLFRQLTEGEHLPEGEALARTLEAAKNNGCELTADDILERLEQLENEHKKQVEENGTSFN